MTNREAVIWLINLTADIGKAEHQNLWHYEQALSEIADMIEQLPSAERKKGEWLEITNTNHTYVCSVCGRMLVNITAGKNTVTKNYPFCHCGADMREREEE